MKAAGAAASDRRDARRTESAGSAAGLGALVERCQHVWHVEADEGATEQDSLALCAVLASVALGPVLPEDGATLLGMRGAAERGGVR